MLDFLKKVGKGILYLLVLPAIIVCLLIVGALGIFAFIYLGIKSIILYFTGRSLYKDLPEDKKAKEIINSPLIVKSESTSTIEQPSAPIVSQEHVANNENNLYGNSHYENANYEETKSEKIGTVAEENPANPEYMDVNNGDSNYD